MNVRTLFDLTGRIAIITGRSMGLGRQMAQGLAEIGANLALCAHKKERCQQAADELQQFGIRALAIACEGSVLIAHFPACVHECRPLVIA